MLYILTRNYEPPIMNRRSLWLEKVKLVNWTNGWCASILSFSEEALSQLNLRKLSRVPLSDQDEVWTERWRMPASGGHIHGGIKAWEDIQSFQLYFFI